MGAFYVDCEIEHLRNAKKKISVAHLLVDSASAYTWILGDTLKKIGVAVKKKGMPFLMANGQQVTRSIGYAILRSEGFKTVDEVVFAEPGDLQLVGSRTLEGFAAMVDPQNKRLIASGPIPAAGAIRGGH